MFLTFLQVALGGALGAMARFGVGLSLARLGEPGFPVAILAVNVLGSFVMGVFAVLSWERGLAHLAPFVMTGMLGGFTTFSAFSLETFTLIERGQIFAALVYVALSVLGSIAALMLAIWITRGLGT
ncbi:fluoride efflux transporter CrcB [Roseovarius spongiae]|uniref:Fluoride-specific ion channel FluC n=1 Tax=Roseovarius spongiae TaxID=2320272 RepID=A0A3A8B7V5_9RHOB|nr:fluoride efflux transporter CrcB [Roseovarius spongiae]RKF13089.1 fluoride efflux transporter CrcB [Roseovarius spongiae]